MPIKPVRVVFIEKENGQGLLSLFMMLKFLEIHCNNHSNQYIPYDSCLFLSQALYYYHMIVSRKSPTVDQIRTVTQLQTAQIWRAIMPSYLEIKV